MVDLLDPAKGGGDGNGSGGQSIDHRVLDTAYLKLEKHSACWFS